MDARTDTLRQQVELRLVMTEEDDDDLYSVVVVRIFRISSMHACIPLVK